MKKFLNGILGKLPFNGWKTALGFIGVNIAPYLPAIQVLTLPVIGPVSLPMLIAGLATTYGTIGVVHNVSKH